jgi:CotH kinase protein/Putative metal-binding motif
LHIVAGMKQTVLAFVLAPLLAVGCGEPPAHDYSDLDQGCPPVLSQNAVSEYHVEIAPAEMAALHDEFVNLVANRDAGLETRPYHPITLHIVEADAAFDPANVSLRLQGQSSWLQTLMLDENPKMQFVIAFNQIDAKGRFEGMRKITLHMPRTDQTFLHDRVATSWLREAGIPAQCANSARLYLNGEYYGLYTAKEHQDKSWLKRVFPGDADGDLWKGGREIRTNEDNFTWDRLDTFWAVHDYATLDQVADLDASMREWAAEALLGDADGYNNGRANFYLYDSPVRGKFVWLGSDFDTVLDADFLAPESPPIFNPVPAWMARWEPDWQHYLIALGDPAGEARYVNALRELRAHIDVGSMQERIDDWSRQIRGAVADDPHKWYTTDDHRFAVERMHEYVAARLDYIDRWLDCRDHGGPDADGDGVDMCHDCNDADPAQRPGAPEICNAIDDDCNGRIDDVVNATCE